MKNTMIMATLLLSLTACDAPVRPRTVGQGQNLLNTGSSGNAVNYNTGTLGNGGTTGTTTGGSTTPVTSEVGFSSCDISSRYSSSDMGAFGLCQSTATETTFKVKFAQTTSTRNCLIPLYKDSTGSSTYVGQPQCTLVNQADAIITGSLLKNRSGFESYPINGVIVLREELLQEYFMCMHGYINWLPQACPQGPNTSQYCIYWYPRCGNGPRTNVNCDAAAKDYMAQVCNSFKSKYSGKYSDIRTK